MGRNEERLVGVSAVLAAIRRRPESITRFFLREDRVPVFRDYLAVRAAARLKYEVVGDQALEKLSESTHHEGVCAILGAREPMTLPELMAERPAVIVALEGVKNPHNLGAIVRTAAHFGVGGVLLREDDAPLSTAAMRIAEGGGEEVPVLRGRDLVVAVDRLRDAGYTAVATSSHEPGTQSLYATKLPSPIVWIFGSEAEGVSPDLLQSTDLLVAIPGSGAVESLNVGNAAAVCLGETWRQRTAKRA